jgi:hypothetical protein
LPCQNVFSKRKTQSQSIKKAHSRIHGITETGLFMPLLTTPTGGMGDAQKCTAASHVDEQMRQGVAHKKFPLKETAANL